MPHTNPSLSNTAPPDWPLIPGVDVTNSLVPDSANSCDTIPQFPKAPADAASPPLSMVYPMRPTVIPRRAFPAALKAG